MRLDVFIGLILVMSVVLCTTGFFIGQRIGEMHCVDSIDLGVRDRR